MKLNTTIASGLFVALTAIPAWAQDRKSVV